MSAIMPQLKEARADATLQGAAKLWFLVAVIGQLMFAYYIVSFYGGTALKGDFEIWKTKLEHGIIENDIIGNFFLIAHLALAAYIVVGGMLQFIPQLQSRARNFHRWNGRLYIITAFMVSLAGLAMIFLRGAVGSNIVAMGNFLNASLIMIFAIMTWRHGRARDIESHRRWALRTFLMVSGVWFFRIGFGLWIFLNNGSAPGSTENLNGPFDIFLAFGHSLIPLFFLELYLCTQDNAGALGKFIMATVLLLLTAAMGAGIFMATLIFWL